MPKHQEIAATQNPDFVAGPASSVCRRADLVRPYCRLADKNARSGPRDTRGANQTAVADQIKIWGGGSPTERSRPLKTLICPRASETATSWLLKMAADANLSMLSLADQSVVIASFCCSPVVHRMPYVSALHLPVNLACASGCRSTHRPWGMREAAEHRLG